MLKTSVRLFLRNITDKADSELRAAGRGIGDSHGRKRKPYNPVVCMAAGNEEAFPAAFLVSITWQPCKWPHRLPQSWCGGW